MNIRPQSFPQYVSTATTNPWGWGPVGGSYAAAALMAGLLLIPVGLVAYKSVKEKPFG